MAVDYICKIASLDELNEKWDYEIRIHRAKVKWRQWRDSAVENHITGKAIVYVGKLNGTVICEATANFDASVVQNSDGLVGDNMVCLTAFRTNKGYEGQGYFSKLYKFMEQDLKAKGVKVLTIGVEPVELRNHQIYTKWGFTDYIKSAYEIYPPERAGGTPERVLVNYYSKKLA